jgi:glutamine amidotransferase-like uncharacterized protein
MLRSRASIVFLLFLCFAAPALPVSAKKSPAPRVAVPSPERLIRVALYTDEGSLRGADAVEKCLEKVGGRYIWFRVTAQDIRGGALANADVLVQGGGSGSKQAKALQPVGCEEIKRFVQNGGGYIGICAGAYLASSHYTWSLNLINAKVIDREHWARGGGTVQLRVSDKGRSLLGLNEEIVACRYNQGPLLGPHDRTDLPAYDALATYETEIAKNGAPKGVMKGTTAIASAPFGEGRVMCISPHPESTQGLDGVIRRAVEWAAPSK